MFNRHIPICMGICKLGNFECNRNELFSDIMHLSHEPFLFIKVKHFQL